MPKQGRDGFIPGCGQAMLSQQLLGRAIEITGLHAFVQVLGRGVGGLARRIDAGHQGIAGGIAWNPDVLAPDAIVGPGQFLGALIILVKILATLDRSSFLGWKSQGFVGRPDQAAGGHGGT